MNCIKNNKLAILNQINNINNDIALATNTLTEEKNKEVNAVKDAMKFTADFYKEMFKVYGEKGEQLAKALAEQSRGKKIRNVDDALKAYAKHQANINKKINAKDRAAIANALESVKVDDIAKNFTRFSKAMKYTSHAIDFVDWALELKKAVLTDNWRPFFVKTETIVAGIAATAVAGFAFSVILGGPVGVLGYGLIVAATGSLIDDNLIEKANQFWGI
ncbi:colicin-like pore-forming protein [Arsenophonus apicola]|uniref:colicin-like pore-forming protein n=1 Tax=Arsenophonus apicola TaxID=2879119 RepID=UPI003158DB52